MHTYIYVHIVQGHFIMEEFTQLYAIAVLEIRVMLTHSMYNSHNWFQLNEIHNY